MSDTDDGCDGDERENDLHVEITPLTPPRTSYTGRRPNGPMCARTHWRRLWLPLLTLFVLIVALGVALGVPRGILPAFRGTLTARFAAPTPAPTLAPLPIASQLGAAPTDCPPGNGLTAFSPDYAPGVGVSGLDVWLIGFAGATATLHPALEATADGFPAHFEVVAGRDMTQPLTLTIKPVFESSASGADTYGYANPTRPFLTVTLVPNTGHLVADGYRSWRVQFSLPMAGCYYLGISGSSGTFFSAGG